jgi:hypothetical protein
VVANGDRAAKPLPSGIGLVRNEMEEILREGNISNKETGLVQGGKEEEAAA